MNPSKDNETHDILLVTGFSGAGKSSALKILEDMGYDVIDNLPMDQVENILKEIKDLPEKLAFGLDSRTHGFSSESLLQLKTKLQDNKNYPVRVLYLFCEKDTLVKRYSETRRKHPLGKEDGYVSGIEKEDKLLGDIPHFADILIDTTTTNSNDLRDLLKDRVDENAESVMNVKFVSFGFKNGVPKDADMVIDVRFLKNPHWKSDLKVKTGKSDEVAQYIQTDPAYKSFYKILKELLEITIPAHKKAGKSYFTVALGCTGGKHRSVHIAEKLFIDFQSLDPSVMHRDLGLE